VNRPKEESPFEEEVRVSFFKRLGIVSMPLHDALRYLMVVCLLFLGYHRLTSIFHSLFSRLLTDSGFRLPTEGQKIERILQSFGTLYLKENPSFFDDPGVCVCVCVCVSVCVCVCVRQGNQHCAMMSHIFFFFFFFVALLVDHYSPCTFCACVLRVRLFV